MDDEGASRQSWWRTLTQPGIPLLSTIALVIWVTGMTAWSVSQPPWSGAITAVTLLGALVWGVWMRRRDRGAGG